MNGGDDPYIGRQILNPPGDIGENGGQHGILYAESRYCAGQTAGRENFVRTKKIGETLWYGKERFYS
jgi:hypothetical protein